MDGNTDDTRLPPASPTSMRIPRHGRGRLRTGNPGCPTSGRPSDRLYKWLRLRQPSAQRAVEEILADPKHPQRFAAARFVLELAMRDQETVILTAHQLLEWEKMILSCVAAHVSEAELAMIRQAVHRHTAELGSAAS